MKEIFKSHSVVLEMLSDRGYKISESDAMTYENFTKKFDDEFEARKGLTKIFNKGDNQIVIFWIYQIGVGEIQTINNEMNEKGIKHSIVIYKNKITAPAQATMRQLRVQGIIIEIFVESSLQYNVTKSCKVPKHIICSKEKKEEIMKKYKITKDQIPQIKVDDPVVKYYGAVKGQLVKILRPSESVKYIMVGETKKELFDISYRIVV